MSRPQASQPSTFDVELPGFALQDNDAQEGNLPSHISFGVVPYPYSVPFDFHIVCPLDAPEDSEGGNHYLIGSPSLPTQMSDSCLAPVRVAIMMKTRELEISDGAARSAWLVKVCRSFETCELHGNLWSASFR
jgi:hypothetical protein